MLTLELIGDGEFKNVELLYGDETRFNLDWCLNSITSLIINDGITRLPDFSSLKPKHIFCYNSLPAVIGDIFANYDSYVHVPKGAIDNYSADCNWGLFTHINDDVAPLESISIQTNELNIRYSETKSLMATVRPSSLYADLITYSLIYTDGNHTYSIDLTADGNIKGKYIGEDDIIVSCVDKMAICHVKIYYDDFTLNFSQEKLDMIESQSATLLLTRKPQEDIHGLNISVMSSNQEIVKVERVINTSLATYAIPIKAVESGYCNIIATCGNHKSECLINVAPLKIDINPEYLTIGAGRTKVIQIANEGIAIKATSSNPDVAIADARLRQVYISALQPGFSTITIAEANNLGQSAKCVVHVVDDLNKDGYIDVGDVNTILKAIIDGESDSTFDLNCDGIIDVGDINTMLQAIL